MELKTFEKRVAELGKEQGWIPSEPNPGASMLSSFFSITTISNYKRKYMSFHTTCKNLHIAFEVVAETFDDLFDKAFRMVKAANRITNPNASKAQEKVESVE